MEVVFTYQMFRAEVSEDTSILSIIMEMMGENEIIEPVMNDKSGWDRLMNQEVNSIFHYSDLLMRENDEGWN